MLNLALKPGLKENENYILVDKDTWAIFENYERYELKRLM
jgi:hypothetical protein